MTKVIIRHLSGYREDQIETLSPIEGREVILGREEDSDITFDSHYDDVVSRRHAALVNNGGDRYILKDLHSRNGTFVNRQAVDESVGLQPGDLIQLGKGGPEVQFDLQPRPADTPIPSGSAKRLARETRIVGNQHSLPDRSEAKGQKTPLKLLVLIGVLTLLCLVFITLWVRNITWSPSEIAPSTEKTVTNGQMAPSVIAERYGPATVYIEAVWKLVHLRSGRQVYHYHQPIGGRWVPVYVQDPSGRIEPWLVLDNKEGVHVDIGGSVRGSGFVVDSNGFILTNRHVVAGWWTRYTFDFRKGGLVYSTECAVPDQCRYRSLSRQDTQQLRQWTPVQSRYVSMSPGEAFLNVPQAEQLRNSAFDGRMDSLLVQLPDDRNQTTARIIRISPQADAALIKVDIPGELVATPIRDTYEEARVGDGITVLGYPAISPDAMVGVRSVDPMKEDTVMQIVPRPTLSVGHIGKIVREQELNDSQVSSYSSGFGDTYQLTINSTGAGNSGGPVLNEKGEVIGIFTYGNSTLSFAIPIRYGAELLGNVRKK